MSFCIFNSDIALCSGESVIICNLNTNEEKAVTLPKLEISKENQAHNKEDIESFHALTSVLFSKDGEYLAICTNRKQLCLFRRKNQELVSNRTLARAASKVRFVPNNDIVVADKSGDAYLYSTSEPVKNGTLLLGHLSMLLDVLVTDDEKYIITTDRDEKIRISMFPNSYNIVSYCLGHEQFVTNIEQVPHKKHILVSCGGDGMFILWDYKSGKEISRINFANNISQEDVQQFNKNLKNYDFDEKVITLPVKHVRVSKQDENTSILVASFYCSKRILIYKISDTNFQWLNYIDIDSEPLEYFLQQNGLWILTNKSVVFYELKDYNFIKSNELDNKLERLNESWKKLRNNVSSGTLFPILYKRKYDNVQEYQERKKNRLVKTLE